MASTELNALIDTDVLLDFLDGFAPAAEELRRYRRRFISIISWMEVMAGARTPEMKPRGAGFLVTLKSCR